MYSPREADVAKQITRRDFLNGAAMAAGMGLLSPTEAFAQAVSIAEVEAPVYYPPLLNGMRGSHPGSFEVAHALAWAGEKPFEYEKLDEHYDLIVVGAGISGLSAAHFYRKKMGTKARILILDNHDDFGGHAKRNEFQYKGRMLLGIGGAQNLTAPDGYSLIAKGLINDLGIDTNAMRANTANDFAMGNFGANNALSVLSENGRLTVNGNWALSQQGQGDYEGMVNELPLDDAEKGRLIEFFSGDRDYLDEMSLTEKLEYVSSTSYGTFLTERVGLQAETVTILDAVVRVNNGFTGWSHSVLEAILYGSGGLQSMGWLASTAHSMFMNSAEDLFSAEYFPDGNSSVARLLVHKMIPNVAPDTKGFVDIAVSRFDYDELDRESNNVRLRLNSTAVGARNTDSDGVEVDYVRNGEAQRVSADRCILACYNSLIPLMCPELPEEQKEALKYGVKIPLTYANVLLDNGRAFSKLDASLITCPMDPFTMISTAPLTTTGGFEPPRSPDDPMVVFMMANPAPAPTEGQTVRDVCRIGRALIYATSFESYEQQIREQLQSMYGEHGFNHETDIKAITVNRWPHGYAYWPQMLDDPEWEPGQAPHEVGRRQFGRISIANSDAHAYPMLEVAVESGWRAVQEQTS